MQCKALQEHLKLLPGHSACGLRFELHPMCNRPGGYVERLGSIRVIDYVFFLESFNDNVMVISSCRHFYHPWCTVVHFRYSKTCASHDCSKVMSDMWCKSFGLGDTKHATFAKEESRFCKHSWVTWIHLRRELEICKWRGLVDKKLCLGEDFDHKATQIVHGAMAHFCDGEYLLRFHYIIYSSCSIVKCIIFNLVFMDHGWGVLDYIQSSICAWQGNVRMCFRVSMHQIQVVHTYWVLDIVNGIGMLMHNVQYEYPLMYMLCTCCSLWVDT